MTADRREPLVAFNEAQRERLREMRASRCENCVRLTESLFTAELRADQMRRERDQYQALLRMTVQSRNSAEDEVARIRSTLRGLVADPPLRGALGRPPIT